jgi:predicted TIM-barrel fold metal-dependent hydrolase
MSYIGDSSRRDFLRTTTVAAAAAASGLLAETAEGGERGGALGVAGHGGLVDVNVSLGRWPCRRLPLDETTALVARLRRQGVKEAWAGSFDGLLHKDLGAVNARLAEGCRKHGRGLLVPFGSVNPTLPAWEEDLRRCHEEHRMPGIRLHPNYHGYKLDEAVAGELLDLAAQRGLIVQLALRMDDIRVQHRLMRIPDVDAKPLGALVKARPGLRLVVLNSMSTLRDQDLRTLAATDRVWFEICMREGIGGVANLLQAVPLSRVLFGSHLPLFPLESAVFKMREAGLEELQRQAIEHENAQRLLGGAS